jgi:hypothetical protein
MGKLFTSLAAASLVSALAAPSTAFADFAISKPKPQQQAKPAHPPRNRPVRRPRDDTAAIAETPPPPATGIDPALMQEAIVGAKYRVTLTRNEAAHTAVLQATDGKSGWSVNFKNCVADNRCGSMEFYTLWRTPNEANVCTVWGRDITKDPTHGRGKPFCYTVPGLERQFHLKLSSDQPPYVGLDKMTPAEAKQRMESMIGVWADYLPRLQQAYAIASGKCPRASDKCG